jgi:hypothetical protein
MHGLIARLTRAKQEGGFTMIAAMGVMLAVMALSLAAFAAAEGDMRVNAVNQAQRQAYSAAEAGVADFLFRLSRDPDVWSRCDVDLGQTKISRAWNGQGADPRQWRSIDGTNAQYALEPIAAEGYSECDPAVPASMIDPDTGTFTIRATGKVMDGTQEVKRSVIATFKRKNFLDYIYFTDIEAQDPVLWEKLTACAGNTPATEVTPNCVESRNPTISAWAASQCSRYWRDGRGSADYPGEIRVGPLWLPSNGLRCTEITFANGENIRGPFHTNDGILVQGNPTFGRRRSDPVEVSASRTQQPWRTNSWADPNFVGTWTPGSPILKPPPTNASLRNEATRVYEGSTRIVLNANGTMDVTNQGTTTNVPQPPSGVIYVATSGACTLYDPYLPKVFDGTPATATGCGDLSISGTYTQNLTFAAANDLVIFDDIRKSASHDVILGLIAENFVRVRHKSRFSATGNADWAGPRCTTDADNPTRDIYIDAAILALNHSFTVDRYGCGSSLGELHVFGAIAQKHRGVVGIVNGSGFSKEYEYDDRLRFRTPPKFLDPVNTAWAVARQVEQSPAT